MKVLGYSVAFSNKGDKSVPSLHYHIFPARQDAETVLAGEKLKSPELKWSIVEVREVLS